MEVVVAVQSGTLLHALRVQLKRRVSTRRGGDYNEISQAIQKKSRPNISSLFKFELVSLALYLELYRNKAWWKSGCEP